MNCPCCNQEIPRDASMIFDVESGIVIRNGSYAALTPKEAAVFQSLHAVSPKTRRKEDILTDLYWLAADDDEPLLKILDVYVCKIRRKLKAVGVEIQTVWGVGWRLVPQRQEAELAA